MKLLGNSTMRRLLANAARPFGRRFRPDSRPPAARSRGFSLVDALLAIAALSLFTAITVPAYQEYRANADASMRISAAATQPSMPQYLDPIIIDLVSVPSGAYPFTALEDLEATIRVSKDDAFSELNVRWSLYIDGMLYYNKSCDQVEAGSTATVAINDLLFGLNLRGGHAGAYELRAEADHFGCPSPGGTNATEIANFTIEGIDLSFVNPPDSVEAGEPVTLTLQLASTPSGIPVAGYDLYWSANSEFSDYSDSGFTKLTDADGETTISLDIGPELVGDLITVSVYSEPLGVYADTLFNVIGVQYDLTPGGTVPNAIIPPFMDPEVSVRVLDDGLPVDDIDIYWLVQLPTEGTVYAGSFCTPASTTVGGQATIKLSDFDGLSLPLAPGTYAAYAGVVRPEQCRGGTRGDISDMTLVATFGVEEAELVFENPPSAVNVGEPAIFPLLFRTTPSNTPLPGYSFDWEVQGVSAQTGQGVTAATDGDGRTSVTLTTTEGSGEAFLVVTNSQLGVSESSFFVSFDRYLDLSTNPPTQNYSEELASGFSVYTSSGPDPDDAGPDAGVPVSFSISSGNAVFSATGSAQMVVNSNKSGIAASSTLEIGRTDSNVLVTVSAPGRTSVEAVYNVVASTYSLQAQGPAEVQVDSTQTVDLAVQALRQGSSTPVPLGAGETVSWTVTPPSGGASVVPSVLTDASGIATTTFTPGSEGVYQVIAEFDSGLGSASPATQAFTVTVTVTPPTPSLAPYQGDMVQAPPGSQVSLVVRYFEDGVPTTPGNPLAIRWEVLEGDASVAPATSPINSSTGTAGATVTLGNQPGQVAVQATLTPGSGSKNAPNGGITPVTTVFYLVILDQYTLLVTDPADKRVSAQPGDPFDVTVNLSNNQGAGVEEAYVSVDGEIADLPSALLTDNAGNAVLSATAPQQPGTYFINFRFQPYGDSTGQGELADTVRIDVIADDGGETGFGRLIATEGNGQVGLIGQPALPLRVLYTIDDVPTPGITVEWTVQGTGSPASDSTVTNGEGIASFDYTFGSAGNSIITARIGEVQEQFLITAVPGQLGIVSGDGQSGDVGETLAAPLVVQLSAPGASAGASVANVPVTWTVVSGGGSVSQNVVSTDAAGRAAIDFTLGAEAGAQQVSASAAGASATFNFTATAAEASATLSIISGNGQQGPVQTLADAPLVVELLDGKGSPLAGQPVQWTLLAGDAVLDGQSGPGVPVETLTDGSGRASLQFRYGNTPGAISIQAGTPDSLTPLVFVASALMPGLSVAQGDNQSGEVGTTLPQDLVVSIAPGLTKALGGVSVAWEVLSGDGSLAAAVTTTDANGQARNQWTLGSEPGQNQVRARVVGSSDSVTFNATASAVSGALAKVSGDNQTDLPTNTDSAPLVVRLSRSDGTPISGATITWTGSNAGFPVEGQSELATTTTSPTNAQGEARIVTRVTASGAASVQASAPDVAAEPVVFSLTGLIANTDRLGDNERGIAEVLDNACEALERLANPTPAQLDLLQRCRELQDSAGDNPDDVSDALSEMEADVGTTLAGAGLEVITAQVTNVSSYLVEARNRGTGGGSFKVGMLTSGGLLPLSFLPSAILSAEDSAEGQDLGPDFGRWGFFASGQIGRGKYRRGERTPDYDYSSGNLTMGVDYRVNDTLILGAGLGFSRHDTDLRNDAGNLETSGWNLIGYGTWYNERQWFVDSVLSIGSNDYDLTRRVNYRINAVGGGVTVIDQIASASTKGDQFGFSLSVGRDWQKGPWSINSYLRGNYLRTEYDAYEETMLANLPGAGLALAVEARDLKSTTSVLGGKATYVLSRDWGILMPYGMVEWEHRFDDDPARLVTRFIADPTGSVTIQTGDVMDSDYFNVGLGLSALWPGGRSAYIAYERLVSAARQSQDTLSVGIRIEF